MILTLFAHFSPERFVANIIAFINLFVIVIFVRFIVRRIKKRRA